MTYLERMLKAGIPVNWLTVMVGWDGPGGYDRLLSIPEVASYAAGLLGDDSGHPAEVLKLAAAYDGDIDLVDSCVRKLAAGEKNEPSLELRKWRLVLLEDLLETLGDDPLYGLLGLTEFWAGFGYPADAPQIIQGKGRDLSASDYTPKNYRLTLEAHRRWAESERTDLTHSH